MNLRLKAIRGRVGLERRLSLIKPQLRLQLFHLFFQDLRYSVETLALIIASALYAKIPHHQ